MFRTLSTVKAENSLAYSVNKHFNYFIAVIPDKVIAKLHRPFSSFSMQKETYSITLISSLQSELF